MNPVKTPRVAVIGLTLDLYDRAVPGYMDRLQAQFERLETKRFNPAKEKFLTFTHLHQSGKKRLSELQNHN